MTAVKFTIIVSGCAVQFKHRIDILNKDQSGKNILASS